jgi:hypothetical protein
MSEEMIRTGTRMRDRAMVVRLARGAVTLGMTVVLGIVLYGLQPQGAPAPPPTGVQQVSLVQRDRDWQPIPLSRGGAAGSVWYDVEGRAFSFQLRAAGLVPRERYVLVLRVDSTEYATTCRVADAHGEIAIDTALTTFAAGGCTDDADAPSPQPVRGAHDITFHIERGHADVLLADGLAHFTGS